MKMITILGLFAILFLSGCTQIVGNDKDIHGCIGSAGYSWCDAKQKCLRSWEENCTKEVLPEEHLCTAQESSNIACTMDYNPVCGRIVLNMGKTIYQTFGNGCSACASMKVVGYTPGECPLDKTADMCSDNKGNYMTLTEALTIAKASECGDRLDLGCSCPSGYVKDGSTCNPSCYYSTPKCLMASKTCDKTYVCNEGTGTYWINMNLTKEGCSPACVVDVANQSATINWRCTGAKVTE